MTIEGESVGNHGEETNSEGDYEGAQGISVMYQGEEERQGVCLSKHGWHVHYLGPTVSSNT